MTPFEVGLIMTGVLLILVILGMRVAFAAALVGVTGLIVIFSMRMGFERGFITALKMAGTVPHSKSLTYSLSVLPTFMLIGYLAFHAGLTRQLFEAAKRWLGWLPGGMTVGTIFATASFAAVSGASMATAAVFARVAIPEMLAEDYSKRLSAAVVATGDTLASLIPPSSISPSSSAWRRGGEILRQSTASHGASVSPNCRATSRSSRWWRSSSSTFSGGGGRSAVSRFPPRRRKRAHLVPSSC
ncbi:TRAP transporter large permease subunit [Breoghania sp.]|uniref:TRAP transporter large permease subunit n=1 Tax=Breoghania sp. TaxID=2065378 RepID=UPI00261BB40C|nr:TRAP transporter large permease subunit [Breoghania sp.]MDJ0930113.1 TRAP transporter large permease subunit [Breoghania sp.]